MSGRQPRDLRGLLKFCSDYTRSEDPTTDGANLDPERKEFLESVLKDLSVDVIKEFTESIKVLTDPKVQDENADNVEDQLYALDCVEDWVGQIDMAVNFHKVGGFEALLGCLKSPHDTLRAQAAHVIGELTENNPYCQSKLVEEDFLSLLQEIMDGAHPESVKIKALYAVSCILRQSPESQKAWIDMEGPSILLRVLMTSVPKLKIKSCFLIACLCEEDPKFRDIFLPMGTHLHLASLILHRNSDDGSEEYVAKALYTLLNGADASVINEIASNPKLLRVLHERIKDISDKEECEEEKELCVEIVKICSKSQEVIDR